MSAYVVTRRDRIAHLLANAVLRLASRRYRAFVGVVYDRGLDALNDELGVGTDQHGRLVLTEVPK